MIKQSWWWWQPSRMHSVYDFLHPVISINFLPSQSVIPERNQWSFVSCSLPIGCFYTKKFKATSFRNSDISVSVVAPFRGNLVKENRTDAPWRSTSMKYIQFYQFYYQMIRMSYVRQDIKLEECFYARVFSS